MFIHTFIYMQEHINLHLRTRPHDLHLINFKVITFLNRNLS